MTDSIRSEAQARPHVLLGALALSLATPLAWAQADAQKAYQEALSRYGEEAYEQARDLLIEASRTDVANPEVFLWLGRAHYQLGELDRAVAAWQRALKLAPGEPFATRMLAALRGGASDTEAQIRAVEVMLREDLLAAAGRECTALLRNRALTMDQRSRIVLLQAEVLLEREKAVDALAALRKLLAEGASEAQVPAVQVLVARAKLRLGQTVDGLGLLRGVVADHAGTPAAVDAELELLLEPLSRAPTAPLATALSQWIEAHGEHPRLGRVQQTLIGAYLRICEWGGAPGADAALDDAVKSALTVVQQAYEASNEKDDRQLTTAFLEFLDSHYGAHGAHTAAIDGVTRLLANPLSLHGRRQALGALARHQIELAMRELQVAAAAGTLRAGAIPEELQAALRTLATIANEFPADPAGADRIALAERTAGLASKIAWPERVEQPRLPSAWAMEIALPLIAGAGAKVSDRAVKLVAKITAELAPLSRDAALVAHRRLLAVLPVRHGRWQQAIRTHVEMLDGAAREQFMRRVAAGRGTENGEMSALQRELIDALAMLVRRSSATAETARQRLAAHLQPWLEHGHFAVIEGAWARVAPALPAAQQRRVALTTVQLQVEAVLREHRRLQSAGRTVPRQLDPVLAGALQRLYLLQDGVAHASAFGNEVRQAWDGIVGHYVALEYFETAREALAVRGERPVALATQYAELQAARLASRLAERELVQLLARHDGRRQIELTPAFRTALDSFLKFLTDHPESELSPAAIEGVTRIASIFEQHHAYRAAAVVLGDFAAAAERIPLATQVEPAGASAVERAQLRRVRALHAAARHQLGDALAHRLPGAAPPSELSVEYLAAAAAYRQFLMQNPGSRLWGEAVTGSMTIGVEYANVGGWDVAERVYAALLEAGLSLRHPERLQFCRGLCKLGPSMPDHARQVLVALVSRPIAVPSGASAPTTGADPRSGSDDFFLGRKELSKDKVRRLEVGARASRASGEVHEETVALVMVADEKVLQTIRQQEAGRAAAIAQLRDHRLTRVAAQGGQQVQQAQQLPVTLSPAELARLRASIDAAYEVFMAILKGHPHTPTAEQARAELMVMIGHWRSLAQWADAAGLAERFLRDRPDDAELPKLRLEVARDYLSLAAMPVRSRDSVQSKLAITAQRFDAARTALLRIPADFPRRRALVHQAQWDVAQSWLTQARAVAAFSATLARGQFVRASRELQGVATAYHDHPNIGQVPDMLWGIAHELLAKGFFEEANVVFGDLVVRHPAHGHAGQAQLMIAQVYQNNLRQPLRAAEAYQELNFARGGNDQALQESIFQIGLQLQGQRRWVEALYVLETFVDSFPNHANAGQALTLLGSIHQTNEAWEDAIAAYRRVISDYGQTAFVKSARWSIAECVINLSRWSEAVGAYRDFIRLYPGDGQSEEAGKRIAILQNLERYQKVVDEEGQRKAFDAQYQIASIVRERLANPIKAIIEFRRVKQRWPESHLADDALYEVGATYLSLGDPERARQALQAVAADYPTSPLADDALYLVGKSYEDEALALITVTRAQSVEMAVEVAQRAAFSLAREGRRKNLSGRAGKVAELKKQGKLDAAANEEASNAAFQGFYANANVGNLAQWAAQEAESLTATELADRQDKYDAALRRAVEAYVTASRKAGGDKAGDALLAMAKIQDEQLKDTEAAMTTWLEIVRQFSGTAVAENASWRIAQYYEQAKKHAEAIEALSAFLRNYRRSPKAGDAQIAIAENHEQLGQWVSAMDAYTNYINNFEGGPLVAKAREQIQWIKTYRL